MTDYPQNYRSIRADYTYVLARRLDLEKKIKKLPKTREIDPSLGEKEMSAILVGTYIETKNDLKFIDPETGLTRVVENSEKAKSALWLAGYINIDWAAKTAKSKRLEDIAKRAVEMHMAPWMTDVESRTNYVNERFYYIWQLEKETGYNYEYGGIYKKKTANAEQAKDQTRKVKHVEYMQSDDQNSLEMNRFYTLNFSNINPNRVSSIETTDLQEDAISNGIYNFENENIIAGTENRSMNNENYVAENENHIENDNYIAENDYYYAGMENYTTDTEDYVAGNYTVGDNNYYTEDAFCNVENDYYNDGIPTCFNSEENVSVDQIEQDVDEVNV